ncbi:hypothetical protein DY000_02038675 [Brassica cretica]|uniref:Uncharacterized protein n=1 Tax=Brassica cretica TaxID=69181 RepID=A0ABQ7B9H2_BRACR|nr:hypothetical protein DY000_02038675 [Brassica cretica]
MDYVRGRGSRDVCTSDAALVGGGSVTPGLATQIVWGVGAETFAFDAALEGRGTKTDCTSDAAYASCLFMLELNFHSGSSIYSSQWNKKSRSNFGRKTKYAFAGRLLQTINQGSQEGLQNQRSEMRTISLDPKDEQEE